MKEAKAMKEVNIKEVKEMEEVKTKEVKYEKQMKGFRTYPSCEWF